MYKYLGDFQVKLENTPFANHTPLDWIMTYIERYSQIEGAHHKQWVLDQIARIRLGTPVLVNLAKWSDGTEEYRFNLGEPSQEYMNWVTSMKGEWDEDEQNFEYGYDEGIAP